MQRNNKIKVYIAGQNGMVGSALYKFFQKKKFNILSCERNKLDLTNQKKVFSWIKKNKPDLVINAAGKVGGILDNSKNKDEYLYINSMIGLNLVNACHLNNIENLINLGSVCIYPKLSNQPIKEEYLLSSKLEPSNEGYALAKIAVLKYCEYINQKYKRNYITLQPANLYGEGDNFNLKTSHVIPALIKKFHLAKIKNLDQVEVWGSGIAEREFLHVNDLASAVYFCFKKKVKKTIINVGGPDKIKIKKLCYIIKKIINYKGKIFFNKNYPNGVLKRSVSKKYLNGLGWRAKTKLISSDGLPAYYNYYKKIS